MSIDIRVTSEDISELFRQIAAGKIDPELSERVHKASVAAREATFRKHGLLNVAVDLIREARDGDDE